MGFNSNSRCARGKTLAEACVLALASIGATMFSGRAAAQRAEPAGVTQSMLLEAQEIPDAWATYGRNYAGWRYAPSAQINRDTVKRLAPKWTYQTGMLGAFETTALMFDARLYVTTPNSHLFCIDAKTGRGVWRYDHKLPPEMNLCCGPVNRGVAALGNRVYLGTLDARLVCLRADTGRKIWDIAVADYHEAYSLTLAPLAVKNMVIVGVSGAEYGIRGFIDAYDAESGKRVWRFDTVPSPGEPGNETWSGDSWKHGGGAAWVTGTYDPALNLLYWGIGNPSPDFDGGARAGDNLYTGCVVALNPDSGRRVWHFQTTPHDLHDWDATSEPILVDEIIKGREVKALIQVNRNGYAYALDRTNGEFLYASPYTRVNWAKLDERGIPRIKPELAARNERNVCPGIYGGKNWPPAAYSPKTHLVYIPEMERCATYTTAPEPFQPGKRFNGGFMNLDKTAKPAGHLKAMDVRTGEIKWTHDIGAPDWAGALATGGGLVFAGAPDGYLRAFNDETGEVFWEHQTGSGIMAPPTSFEIDGKQRIGVASGWGRPEEAFAGTNANAGCAYFLFGLVE